MNDNQNYFVKAGRTTSRVSNQPGGRCSISIGGWTEEELQRQREKKAQPAKETIVEQPEKAETATDKENLDKVEEEEEKPQEVKKEVTPFPMQTANRGVSSNAFASSATTNSFNVLTDRPTSKVSAPPGGHCSIRLG